MTQMSQTFRAASIAFAILLVSSAAWGQKSRPAGQPLPSGPADVENRVDSLLRLMTIEEKLGQLNQLSSVWDTVLHRSNASASGMQMLREGRVGSFLNIVGSEATASLQRIAVNETRLKIPLLFGLDVIHGYRTIYPIPLGEAASWDPELAEETARMAAGEAAAAGIHWTFAPMVDIARDPRWGRIAEGSGEDPFLGSAFAAARVRGFQGHLLDSKSLLLATAKHFAAYGGPEGGRDYNTVDMSERTLREMYLPPYRAAVRAGVGTLMSSFNEIGGVPSSASRHLLTDILRKEWQFDGFVVSDWNSVGEVETHGIASDRTSAGILGLTAGVDMDMMSLIYVDELRSALKDGRLKMAVVDEAVRRVLRIKFRMGLFEDPFRGASTVRERAVMMTQEHRALARRAASESFVLLKNENGVLPLTESTRSILVVGTLAESKDDPLGTWSARGEAADVVSIIEGLRRGAPSKTKVTYVRGCGVDDTVRSGIAEAARVAAAADVVIAVLGEARSMSGEAASRSEIGLPGVQEELLRALVATGKKTVVLLMNGRPLVIPWTAEHASAILELWHPGVEAGHAAADVVFGRINPSGKLPATFPRSVGQVPLYYNHKISGRPASEANSFTSKYLDVAWTPQFPFGFGLSYTSFAYSELTLSATVMRWSDSLVVGVKVRNTGKRRGEEVVQLYVRDHVGSVTRPVRELKGFRKIALDPGESKRVTFNIGRDDLAFWNGLMEHTAEPGQFSVYVGTNSHAELSAEFQLEE